MLTEFPAVTLRPYAGEADLPAIADLINTCATYDQSESYSSVEWLRQEMCEPGFDTTRDLRLWHTSDGQLVAVGYLWIPPAGATHSASVSIVVLPEFRQGGIEAQIIAWAEQRMRELARDRGVATVSLYAAAQTKHTDQIALLQQHGFTPERYFHRMARSLSEPIPAPQLPVGFSLHRVTSHDAEAWVEMFNQTFIDHWDFHPMTVERFQHDMTEPSYDPELDLVAIAPDGTFAAFCAGMIRAEDNTRKEQPEGWIGILGTRRGFRNIGLGRAMLLSGLQRLHAKGMQVALLGVDADNPSGAFRLYQSIGFQPIQTRVVCVKSIG